MNFPVYIALRYLFSKKRRNAINIISGISIVGVAVGTMALIVVLSVFNGFDSLLKKLYHSFDPDLKITAAEGKTFLPADSVLDVLNTHTDIIHYSQVIEENALLKYEDQQFIATIKGVDSTYVHVSGVDTMISRGSFTLGNNGIPMAVAGQGIAFKLSLGVSMHTPVKIFVPRRNASLSYTFRNAQSAISERNIYTAGFFSIQQDFDNKYVIVPIDFARDLFEYPQEISALELKLSPGAQQDDIQEYLQNALGPHFRIQNRYEQHAFFYRIMASEKWAVFLILSFILLIASFNIIGSLTMLIIDKKHDINILRSLGATEQSIRNIFLLEGWLITAVGAITGLLIGGIVCFLQQNYGLISLSGSGSFIIDAYPVQAQWLDFAAVFATVMLIGFFAAYYPVRYITRKYALA